MAVLVVFACVAMIIGWAFTSRATVGVAFICSGCVFAILARLVQASDQHQQLLRMTRGVAGPAPVVPTLAQVSGGPEVLPDPPSRPPDSPMTPFAKVVAAGLLVLVAGVVATSIVIDRNSPSTAPRADDIPHFRVTASGDGWQLVNQTSKTWVRCWALKDGRRALVPVVAARATVTLQRDAFANAPGVPVSPNLTIACEADGIERPARLE